MAVKFFDEQWYLGRNPDVAEAVAAGGVTAEQHFEQFGMAEGRSPSSLFDTDYYLDRNPDVRDAVDAGQITAYEHFAAHGHLEGRAASPYFNPDSYLTDNPDVAEALDGSGVSVYEHFQAHGIDEGRAPLSSFDLDHYLTANPDVAGVVGEGGQGAVRHFMTYGAAEARALSPVTSVAAYLAVNEDVLAAVEAGQTTGLAHMLTHGVREDRDLGYGVSSAQFANDPAYKEAIEAGDTDEALARVNDVAPFLPAFQAPEGFQLPADWPIPQDFVPLDGTQLVVPEGWVPAEPVRLPDTFQQPFPSEVSPEGVVTFPGASGEIVVVNQDGQAGFAQGGFLAAAQVPLDGSATVQLADGQVLVGQHGDIAELNIQGEGAVRAEGTAEADEIDATGWNAVNLTVDGKAGDDVITVGDTQSALGGEGADTFVIAATAGESSVITIGDYDFEQGDVIDLTEVEGFNIFAMEVRGAEHGEGGWQWGDGYDGDSVGIWFSDAAANVQITDARHETMKFAIPEVEGFEGYTTLQLNISNGGVMRAGDEAGEILRGGDGTQFVFSGAQADLLSGGVGDDVFVVEGVEDSSLESMDHILDFEAGTDVLVSHSAIAPGDLIDGGSVADLNADTLTEALNGDVFTAHHGAYFTMGEGDAARTFVALNDGTAGFDAATDTVVEVTGFSGNLADLEVIGVPDLSALMEEAQA